MTDYFDFSQLDPYTGVSPDRLHLLFDLARRANEMGLKGDFVECGVRDGGTAAILAHFAAKTNRKLWLFDSFEGLPLTTKEDEPSAGNDLADSYIGDCRGSIERVKEILDTVKADMSRVEIVKGWFQDTFPTVNIPEIALLNLDSDWYESEKLCINKFYDGVVPQGFIYFDDFYWWPGCRKAATEFFRSRSMGPFLNRVGHAAWIQK